ncbi:hypothetical protein KUTeg_005812 [Tegillarca granosa]|uniref:Uncharacterized protein n=1 Tax=Tegillarca granosa TaxID=220873 RepID=A0ABQ9FH80_TEGGR|nr:hypothetical protein KUTeg_005812 [Tegillarca granosa]
MSVFIRKDIAATIYICIIREDFYYKHAKQNKPEQLTYPNRKRAKTETKLTTVRRNHIEGLTESAPENILNT